jgi:hypothetical protein
LDGLSWTVTARPAMTSLVPVERSIRILDIDLGGTVPLVAIPSLLMRRIVVGACSDCWKPITLLDDSSTPSSDVFSHACSSFAVWEA